MGEKMLADLRRRLSLLLLMVLLIGPGLSLRCGDDAQHHKRIRETVTKRRIPSIIHSFPHMSFAIKSRASSKSTFNKRIGGFSLRAFSISV